jgi:predicted secreted Zn-dependent protease
MITDLSTLGYPPNGNPQWYMVEAVQAHELQHVMELKNSLDPEFAAMETAIENLTVRNDCSQNMTAATAKNALKALARYNAAITTADNNSTRPTTQYRIRTQIPMPQSTQLLIPS